MAGAIYSEAQIAVARAFKQARLTAGLDQSELARRIGKYQSYVSDIERGQRRMDVLEVFVLARALGLAAGELYQKLIAEVPDDTTLS